MSELALFNPGRLAARTPEEVRAWMEQVNEMRRAVLTEGVDYGTLPGMDRPTLFDAGAQKMCLLAGLGFTVRRVEASDDGVTYRATVTRPGTTAWSCTSCGEVNAAVVLAECEGYAGFDEDQFFQTPQQQQQKAEKKERYWASYDRRPVKPERFAPEQFEGYKAPRNTLIKMSQKRARVGAISAALALGGLFETEVDQPEPDSVGGRPAGSPPPSSTAARPGAAAPGSRRPVERRRRDEVPVEVYDNLPEAGGPAPVPVPGGEPFE